ncbi:cysteine desulfuration protein SufE [Candidatus Palibaumannia cicadellinicola]|uniref:Sulfur acceptor protein SufE for iron-sulfur cluster assembly n=1 Tax=Candidatus Palibaumannia cicadellinicola TaxID=186490 RepID=A0A088NB88_9GAMM|nr:cysteine desulfuration protein SufE [Candidatus Baumannia cicadellinicola]AIN47378.1 Sulfur acceptor protein SufE for iron-sulfur cluster assembly [Candidatus Baumannia cicadellinicola]
MTNIPNKDKLLRNFSRCHNWEDKYLYIIELGKRLPPLPSGTRTTDYLITGCQSQVWIVIETNDHGDVQFYGDSDAAIIKGLIATVFIIYNGLTLAEIIKLDISLFFHELSLIQHLTSYRSQGLEAMVLAIRAQARALQ